jgi:hypothetical protein
MFTLLFLPFKLAIAFLKLSGFKGLLLLLLGVGIGLLIAPQRGAQLRAQLQARLEEARHAAGAPVEAGQPA